VQTEEIVPEVTGAEKKKINQLLKISRPKNLQAQSL
jgi:hypothetical protein